MLDDSQLHKGSLWAWRVRDGKLWCRHAGGDWMAVGLPGDVAALHKFFGAPWPNGPRWMPWHIVRDWYLKRRAKRIYAKWYETKHKVELEDKKKKRLAELNRLYVRAK